MRRPKQPGSYQQVVACAWPGRKPHISAARLLQVSRYYSFFIVNMVAPIILTTMLGFFVFLLAVDDMEKRLGEPASNPKTATFSQFIGSWRLRQSHF